jgi:predicted lipoprotein with Yx(FWY)xxD motif
MLNPNRTGTRVVGVIAALMIAAACSSSGGASTAPSTAASVAPASVAPASVAPSSEPSEEASAAPSEAAGGSYELTVATSATLGAYLAGEDGKTLYTFAPDTAPNKSTCNGGCATAWPPFLLEDDETATAGTGVSGTIATFARDDATKQVSYNGKPLYYFANDTKAGDTNGEGAGAGKWHVAKP